MEHGAWDAEKEAWGMEHGQSCVMPAPIVIRMQESRIHEIPALRPG
jgi:hypothetical protein